MKSVTKIVQAGRPLAARHGLNLTRRRPMCRSGRSPTHVRRLGHWQGTGTAQAQLVKLVVANLTQDDLVAIAAYIASRPQNAPQTVAPTATN
jgi:hypothetical protein